MNTTLKNRLGSKSSQNIAAPLHPSYINLSHFLETKSTIQVESSNFNTRELTYSGLKMHLSKQDNNTSVISNCIGHPALHFLISPAVTKSIEKDSDEFLKILSISDVPFLIQDFLSILMYFSAKTTSEEHWLRIFCRRFQTKALVKHLRQLRPSDLENLLRQFVPFMKQNHSLAFPWLSGFLDAHQLSLIIDSNFYPVLKQIHEIVEETIIEMEDLQIVYNQMNVFLSCNFKIQASDQHSTNYQLDKQILI